MVYGSFSVLCICLVVGYCCSAFPAIYPEGGIVRMDAALEIAEQGRTVLANINQLGAEPAILILDTMGDVICVALGFSLCVPILVGLYCAAQWGSKLRRQHVKWVNRALKSRRRRPQYPIQSSRAFSQVPTSFTFWIVAIVAINTIGILYACFWMPVVPSIADSIQALHHHADTLTLPPSRQPTHPQWFEPAKRDHVHWMEDFGSSISSTITASRDFWTLKLPTNPGTETQIATPQQCPADSMPGLYVAFHPHLCFNSHRAVQSSSMTADLMHIPAHLCIGTTAAAATAAATGQSNNPIIRLHFTQPSCPASNTSVPASNMLLSQSEETLAKPVSTVPATAVAIYTPIAAVGMCAANFLPAAVVHPSTTAAGQAALDTSEESTAVALYTATPPFMGWANIFWPMVNSQSPTMVTLLLSDSSVESIFNYQDTAAAPDVLTPVTSNIMTTILPQLPSPSHRRVAGQEIGCSKSEPNFNTSNST